MDAVRCGIEVQNGGSPQRHKAATTQQVRHMVGEISARHALR